MTDRRFEGARLPEPRFAGDDGTADPQLLAVLADVAGGRAHPRAAQHALVGRRVLLPTQALLEESGLDESTGLEVEKTSHLAAATLTSPAGWTGLLVFSGMETARAWDADVRPVPVTADEAAASALEDGHDVLVLDVAGPSAVGLSGALLRALAQGRRALPPAEDPEVIAAVIAGARAVDGVRGAEVVDPAAVGETGADAPDAVVLLDLDPAVDAADAASAVAQALAPVPVLRDRLDAGLAFAVAPPGAHPR